MSKRDKVSQILLHIKDQVDELLESPGTDELTEEEIIIIATELVTSSPVTRIQYSPPVATVDRDQARFSIGEFEIHLNGIGEEYYEDE